ncbi:type I-E CRISPR-associated endoribonuclease Cas2e [Lipingzhangella sp. LS1_29]|uniref:Type I-E CRISPR-associated endoribonuclease Cas2e n=1 Tax=Lipingzhangella rawalii TaxID=2055835 RepID=A0ABU2HAD2_9ACTN|nr:type I-E CRISPR-associated endoribonuclease Cas2e [Lipingzhangella rawalii]MDS1272262.1 type I-E CRISPR-associated endoribonuclease Cas2e [Lipingzhangella rawalii]
MTVIVLTHCPQGLRGLLTRWLLEISPGVFIGNPSSRIRDVLWEEVREHRGNGRALLAYGTDTEQGYTFRTFEHKWRPVDHEGLTLIERPNQQQATPQRQGWSKAAKRRRYGKK